MSESKAYYSPEEAAAILGLHVRTVRRFIREGKLKAARVGKQYRISASDLRALAGSDPETEAVRAPKRRRIVTSTIVDIDGVAQSERDRLVSILGGAFPSLEGDQSSRRFDAIYFEDEWRLRLLINADLDITSAVLGMIRVVLEDIEHD